MWPPTTVHLACYHLTAEPESQGTLADTGPLVSEVTHAVGFCLKPWGPHQGLIQGKNRERRGLLKVCALAQRPVSTSLASAHDVQPLRRDREGCAQAGGNLRGGAASWPVVRRDWAMVHKSVKECSLISSGTLLLRAAPFPLHPRVRPEWRDAATTAGFERETQVCLRDGLLRFSIAPEPKSRRWTGASYNWGKHFEPLL